MAYPLVANPIAVSVEIIPDRREYDDQVDFTMTRTTKFDLLLRSLRTFKTEPVSDRREYSLQVDLNVVHVHHFVGIGGLRYLPSFPQLERDVTSWPFAF